MGKIAGLGGANLDVHGKSSSPIIMRDSNPGSLHTSMGGVMRNILDNANRLGLDVLIATLVGDDTYGKILRQGCQERGMDTRLMKTIPGQVSSSYVSIMDNEGDMLVAISDMSILKKMDRAYVEECLPFFNQCDLVVCDGNLCNADPSCLEALVEGCEKPLYMDPVSTAWAKKMLPYLSRFDTIKPNRLEMEILSGMQIQTVEDLDAACDRLLDLGVRRIFTSLGKDGIYYKDARGAIWGRSHGFNQLANATGAGDATMAGILYATQEGMEREETIHYALAAGIAAIMSTDTINTQMSPRLLNSIVKEYVL